MRKLILIIIALLIVLLGVAAIWYLGVWPIDCEGWRDFASRAEFEKTPFIYKNCFK